MPDYSKGKIYTIRNRNDDTKIYVGSTIQPLAVRFAGHKRDSKTERCKNFKLYIEVNNDWDNWYIELYENKSCNNKEELCKREGEIIREIGTLNSRIAGRNHQEYDEERKHNPERIQQKQEISKTYRENHKEEIKEKKKEYREKNIEKIKLKNKEYREAHREEILQKEKEYRYNHKEDIKQKNKRYREKQNSKE